MEYKLCYIDGNKAWFTSNFEHQWGDDWNDAPYEHNAEQPYDHWSGLIEDNEDMFKRKWKKHTIKHKTLYFEIPYYSYLPCDNFLNSPYSVEDINKNKVPWIKTEDFKIVAGTSIEIFKAIVKQYGGKIYTEEE